MWLVRVETLPQRKRWKHNMQSRNSRGTKGSWLARIALTFGVTAIAACGFVVHTAQAEVLEATDNRQWYRGNMHTHSHWSDGDDYLEMIAFWYRERDYQFLVFTDHNVLANTERWIDVEKSKGGMPAFEKLKARFPEVVRERTTFFGTLQTRLSTFHEVADRFDEPGKFLLVQGEEISDRFAEKPIHLCAGNVVEVIPPMQGGSVLETMQNNVRAVIAQREKTGQPMIVHLNHPNYGYAVTAEELMRVRGERFFEVYNGHPSVFNSGDHQHASTDRMWDIILAHRLTELQMPIMYGLAVDDGHNYHTMTQHHSNPGRGWVMVLAKELKADSLIEALEAGQFYASSGVRLRRVSWTEEAMTVEIEPVEGETYETEFIGTRLGFDSASKPVIDAEGTEVHATRIYSNEIGETLKKVEGIRAEYRFAGDELYVRARVTSSALPSNPGEAGERKRAWVQPVLGSAADGE